MNRKLASAVVFYSLSAVWPIQGMAHALTQAECTEGSEFIQNAALARDGGLTREFFVDKLAEDLLVIQSYPPQLRWFVQDASDEQLLTEAVHRVFDQPMPPEDHAAAFIDACMRYAGSVVGDRI